MVAVNAGMDRYYVLDGPLLTLGRLCVYLTVSRGVIILRYLEKSKKAALRAL